MAENPSSSASADWFMPSRERSAQMRRAHSGLVFRFSARISELRGAVGGVSPTVTTTWRDTNKPSARMTNPAAILTQPARRSAERLRAIGTVRDQALLLFRCGHVATGCNLFSQREVLFQYRQRVLGEVLDVGILGVASFSFKLGYVVGVVLNHVFHVRFVELLP